jgi:crotonobetaine/carnitine-CoA ligase
MMSGYLGLPEETARVTRNLWLHSGDAAYEDASGDFVFVDRRKDALRRRGENVSSFEVERLIVQRDDIAEAAVVAVRSEFSEDDLKAFVVLAPGATFDPEAILRDLVERTPYFMVPRYFEAVDELPRTMTHKVQKRQLRERTNDSAWDCEAAGLRVTRDGLIERRTT